jgi:carbon monoxide dehydrogenase subunit G
VPNVDYTAVIDVPRGTVWDFVKDINNWAPLAKGYQSHEIVSDTESIWTVKGDIGPISRTTKFEVHITEWIDGDKVGFTLKGLNESITGEGAITLADTNGGSGTEIRGDALLEFGGSIGPIINHLFVPWAKEGADELVTKIALALEPAYEPPARPFFLVDWGGKLWQIIAGLIDWSRGAEAH